MKWLNSLLSSLGNVKSKADYNALSMKNRYPCSVVGEKYLSDNNDTVILYRISPKKEVFEIALKDLLDDPNLIEKFHPYQAVKLGFMACGDILFKLPPEERYEKFKEISSKMSFSETNE